MNKITSKQTGQSVLSPLQTIVSVCIVFAWIGTSLALYLIGLNPYIVVVFLFVSGGCAAVITFLYVIDKERFDRVVSFCKLKNRARKGDDEILLFKLPLKEIQKHIPIKEVHDEGLIEYLDTEHKMFKKRQFGVLFTYDPPPVPQSHEEPFNAAIKRIVDSFGPDLTVSLHFYDMIDNTNPLADGILKSLNAPDNTIAQNKHLLSMYEAATKNTDPQTSTEYMLSIILGTFKTQDHAMQAYRSVIPGILKSMHEQAIYATPVIGEDAVAIELRKFATMEDV